MELVLKEGLVSSEYIAERTGKLKKTIHRDIERMLSSIDGTDLYHDDYQIVKDERGYIKEYLLNERLSLLLASGYNVKLRLAIIDDWLILKKQQEELRKVIIDKQQTTIDELVEVRDQNRWWMND